MSLGANDVRFEVLGRDECLRLLATMPIGRLAVAEKDLAPLVVPVNYVLDGDVIVFRTDPGDKLRLLRQHPVSFEVDEFDLYRRTGWSVLVQGAAADDELAPWELDALGLTPWAPGDKHLWVRLYSREISGRRIRLLDFPPDLRGYR